MTISRLLLAAFCALAAGVAVENAKATHACPDDASRCEVYAGVGMAR